MKIFPVNSPTLYSMTDYLRDQGYPVNPKRIARLMRKMGIQAVTPGPHTSKRNKNHEIYPYLLRGLEIKEPNQVWSTDITYIPMRNGYMYLVAVMDWYSRYVLSWKLSTTLDTELCKDALEEALTFGGAPEIFNTDQGSQFTSNDFTSMLLDSGIAISMDGKGRALDNVFIERLWWSLKYEKIYPNAYSTPEELRLGLAEYFSYYNSERKHRSLEKHTPEDIYLKLKELGAHCRPKPR